MLDDALALQEAGCFSIVFEAIPAEVTDAIMPYMEIPIIGIGAGPSTDGQVLVLHDLLTIHDDFQPKFAKRFAAVKAEMLPRRRRLRRGGAHAALPGARAHVRDRARGARALPGGAPDAGSADPA